MSANHNHSVDSRTGKAFLISLCLNSLIVLAEIVFGTLAEELHETFEISHTTLQIETGTTLLPCLETACDRRPL